MDNYQKPDETGEKKKGLHGQRGEKEGKKRLFPAKVTRGMGRDLILKTAKLRGRPVGMQKGESGV